MMAWMDYQHSQGMRWEETAADVDVSQAASRSLLQQGPTRDHEPSAVVELVLQAFQRGSDQDIEDLFTFVDPTGELVARHASAAGAMNSFKWKIRKEPRWKNIAARPHAALLHMRAFEIAGGVMTDPDVRLYMVRAQPFFPDATQAESDVIFQFKLVRHRATTPEAAEALGSMHGCWVVRDIAPDYASWSVRNPSGAGVAPDTFKRPKRSAEH